MSSVTKFQYNPELIKGERPSGLSGFMRIRNGEDWLMEAVESHLPFFDEIVAAYNCCTDRTEEILKDLKSRFPDKMKIIDYEPEVYPVGSELHQSTKPDSIHSIANYYNYALSQTTYRVVTKLDDDHVAIAPVWQKMVDEMRAKDFRLGNEMWCFSGINLVMTGSVLKIHEKVPFAGNGDHWFYEIAEGRDFTKDHRFERFNRGGMNMVFKGGIAYWHLKYLKKDHGFSNYSLERNPNSRYHKQLARFESGKEGVTLEELGEQCEKSIRGRSLFNKLMAKLFQKKRLKFKREEAFDMEEIMLHFKLINQQIINTSEK